MIGLDDSTGPLLTHKLLNGSGKFILKDIWEALIEDERQGEVPEPGRVGRATNGEVVSQSQVSRADTSRCSFSDGIKGKVDRTPQPDLPASSAALASRPAPGESTGMRLHPPPDHTPPAAGEEAAEVAARRQRLLALQHELAQLKKTPSMHLLARYRIPRLEAEIKQVAASLEESA